LNKFSIFGKNFDFRTKFQFSTKISIFDQNFDFRPEFPFLTKNFETLTSSPKIEASAQIAPLPALPQDGVKDIEKYIFKMNEYLAHMKILETRNATLERENQTFKTPFFKKVGTSVQNLTS